LTTDFTDGTDEARERIGATNGLWSLQLAQLFFEQEKPRHGS
jgi:hypothetical protein